MQDSVCHSICKSDLECHFFDSIPLEFAAGNQDPLIVESNRFIVSGRNPYNNHTTLENLIIDKNEKKIISTSQDLFTGVWNEGVIRHGENYFSYGDTRLLENPQFVGGYIAKWNENFDSLHWIKPINENALETHVFDLQNTYDDQMVFIHYIEEHNQWEDSLDTRFHFLIKKMNAEGEITKEFYHGNDLYASSRSFPHLLAHSNGSFYFSTLEDESGFDGHLTGILHKINPELDSFDWHLRFPNDTRRPPDRNPFFDPVEYHVYDLFECQNSDVLIGGLLYDRFDDFDSITAEVPFLLRMNSETGEVLWKRVFLTPKDSTDQGVEQTPFRYANIRQIAEDDQGDIYCMGPVLRRNSPEDPRRFDMFLIKINENGCFGEGSCPEDIIMDIDEVITLNPGAYIDPPYPNPVNDYLQIGHIPFDTYSMYDITGKKVQSGNYQNRINMTSMQRGMYFLELMDRKQQAHTFRIVKQ
jgi:hypothetical protein